ncbi:MAG: hypothetical protein EAX95_09255 [Candidatus Thorarchaeota archaeon]|nr:hypothetical protein [Candidatus Thorarchaeota archaeon]
MSRAQLASLLLSLLVATSLAGLMISSESAAIPIQVLHSYEAEDTRGLLPMETTTEEDPLLYSSYYGSNAAEYGAGIVLDSEGNFIVSIREHVLKLDTSGTILSEIYVPNARYPEDMVLDDDDNIYIAGGTSDGDGNAFVIKVNPSGSIIYNTFLAGSDWDHAYSIDVDSSGNVYVTGGTYSPDFPVTSGAYQESYIDGFDCFITKLNSTGGIVYSTFVGGDGWDRGYGIAVDSAGYAYVTGIADDGFPTVNAYQPEHEEDWSFTYDTFVLKLNPSGSSLVYSTYVGGGSHDFAYDIAIDSNGNAYVVGDTGSQDFPDVQAYDGSYNGGWAYTLSEDPQHGDCILYKLNPQGNDLVFSTYFGGAGKEWGNSIALNDDNEIYITGYTESDNFPLKDEMDSSYSGGGDCFVSKFTTNGALLYSTYLGGGALDSGNAIAVDSNNRAYITGVTASTNFPLANENDDSLEGSSDCFITILADTTGRDDFVLTPGIFSLVVPLVGLVLAGALVPIFFIRMTADRTEGLRPPGFMKRRKLLVSAVLVLLVAGYAYSITAPGPMPPPSNSERFRFSSTTTRSYTSYDSPYVEEETEIVAGYTMDYYEITTVTVQFEKEGTYQFSIDFQIRSTASYVKWETGRAFVKVPEGNYTLIFSYYVDGSDWGNPSGVSRELQVDIGQARLDGRNSDQIAYDQIKLYFLGAAAVFALIGYCYEKEEKLPPPPPDIGYVSSSGTPIRSSVTQQIPSPTPTRTYEIPPVSETERKPISGGIRVGDLDIEYREVPMDGRKWHETGLKQKAARNLSDAEKSFKMAVKENPGDAEAWKELWEVLAMLRKTVEAMAAKKGYENALKGLPITADIWAGLGIAR